MELLTPTLDFVNLVINDPAVRPGVQRGTERLDCRAVYEDPSNQLIGFIGGVALFKHLGAAAFEGHVFVLPSYRGSEALAFGKAAVTWLFTGPMALRLSVPVPMVLPAARYYCRKLGLKSAGRDLFQEYFQVEAAEWAAS